MTDEEREAQEEQELIDAMMNEKETDEGEEDDRTGEEESTGDDGEDGINESGDSESEDASEDTTEAESTEDSSGDESLDDETQNQDSTEVDFAPIEVEVNGHKVEITSKEDMMAYIRKGADSFAQKPQTHQEELNIVQQGKLSPEMLKLAVDAQNGSKEAIAKIAEIAKVDVLDLEAKQSAEYKQQFEYTVETEVDKVANSILSDEAHANEFKSIAGTLPQDFMSEITSDAGKLGHFSRHIKEGLAQKVIPLAITAQMKHGGSFMEHYSTIGQRVANAPKQEKRVMSETEKNLRKKASTTNSTNTETSPRTDSAEAVWDLTDEEFAEKFGE